MFDKETSDTIYYEYIETERGIADMNEFGEPEITDAIYHAWATIAPGRVRDIEDVLNAHMFDFIKLGFFCGMRENARHMLGLARELKQEAQA